MRRRTRIVIGVVAGVALVGGGALLLRPKRYVPPGSLGAQVTGFPDKEACSLACAVGWTTHVRLADRYATDGWHAVVGDEINWRIHDPDGGSHRFEGFYAVGDGLAEVELAVNGATRSGTFDGKWFRLPADCALRDGDVITVTVRAVRGDGFVRSIQPAGAH